MFFWSKKKAKQSTLLYELVNAASEARIGLLDPEYPDRERCRELIEPAKAGRRYGKLLASIKKGNCRDLERLAMQLAPGLSLNSYYEAYTKLRIEWNEHCIRSLWKPGDDIRCALGLYRALDKSQRILITKIATGIMHEDLDQAIREDLARSLRNAVEGQKELYHDKRTALLTFVAQEVNSYVERVANRQSLGDNGPERHELVPGCFIWKI